MSVRLAVRVRVRVRLFKLKVLPVACGKQPCICTFGYHCYENETVFWAALSHCLIQCLVINMPRTNEIG